LDVCPTANLKCRSAARWKCRTPKIAKNSPCRHHRTNLSVYISATKAVSTIKKHLLNSNVSPTCPHNMVNFGLIAADICWRVWGHPSKFQRVSRLSSVTALHSSSRRQPNFAALNRGRHIYSAGRPSRWALAHILVLFIVHACMRLSVYRKRTL